MAADLHLDGDNLDISAVFAETTNCVLLHLSDVKCKLSLTISLPRKVAEAFGANVQDSVEECCREHPRPAGVYRSGSRTPERAGLLASVEAMGAFTEEEAERIAEHGRKTLEGA